MTPIIQYSLNTLEIAALYSIVAFGFYLASISTRHFSFAAAVCFLCGPYIYLASSAGIGRSLATLLGLGACGGIGIIYQRFSLLMNRKGAREGQLLIMSLAAMAVGQNVIILLCGNTSRTISYNRHGRVLVLLLGWGLIGFLVYCWHRSLAGKLIRGIEESRLNLLIRGLPAAAIEEAGGFMGFTLIGVSGYLWAFDGRIKPTMCIDIGVLGAVTFIIGSMLAPGPKGLLIAATTLAVIRQVLSLTTEGDWSMTAMVVLLCLALLLRRGRPNALESAQ